LAYVTAMEAISREFQTGLPCEVLYEDDLVLIANSETELIQKLNQWKDGLARKV